MALSEDEKDYLQTHRQAIMATIRRSGAAQLSSVLAVYQHGTIDISTTESRAKYHNVMRDPRVTLLFLGDNFWQYMVIEGEASVVHGEEAIPLLRAYYRAASGEHPDWEEYDAAMRREKRVVVRVAPDRALRYG